MKVLFVSPEVSPFSRTGGLGEVVGSLPVALSKIGIENIEKLNSSTIENDRVIQLTKKSKKMLHIIYDIDYHNFNYKKEPLFDYS